ncbi:MAG: M24 family metallopeptidase [Omnitrophica WOR_2 bacterium]
MENKTQPDSTYSTRQSRLLEELQKAGLDTLALNPGPSLTYLTGLHFHLMERPVVALFFPGREPYIVLPELETAKVRELPFTVQAFTYGDNPQTWSQAFRQAAQSANLNGKKVGVEPTRLRFLELKFLEQAAPQAQFLDAEKALASLRLCKDKNEVDAMRKAVDIAQKAFLATLPSIKIGVTERDIASELTLQLLRAGSQPEMPFSPIVSTGPDSANPHASPSGRVLAEGDLLVVDWGAIYNGYVSDLTRTIALGKIEPEFERIGEIVLEANAAGRAAARPGIRAGEVDRAARQVIEKAGYGQYFFHRVGHGIGMEGHEAPYMYAENDLILEPGMAFTVEPGIYLPERGGVRIEDNVIITANGAETLSDLPRELFHVV